MDGARTQDVEILDGEETGMDRPQRHRADDGVVVQLAQEQALRRLQSILEENREKRTNTSCFPDCLFNFQILNGSAY